MATAIWGQSDFGTENGYNISRFVSGMDFVLNGQYVLTSASVWLVDGVDTSADGKLNSFSDSISWGIFSDAGDGPVGLRHFGDGVILSQVSAGHVDIDNADIVRVDFSFDIPFALDTGTYWFALHEGKWGSGFDGSSVFSSISLSVEGQPSWNTSNLSDPSADWVSQGSEDCASFSGQTNMAPRMTSPPPCRIRPSKSTRWTTTASSEPM